jgi:DNA-binding GntR family transcriptional regulator
VIAALAAGDTERAASLMDEHLESVAGRALIVAKPPKSRELKDILAIYADEKKPAGSANGVKRRGR